MIKYVYSWGGMERPPFVLSDLMKESGREHWVRVDSYRWMRQFFSREEDMLRVTKPIKDWMITSMALLDIPQWEGGCVSFSYRDDVTGEDRVAVTDSMMKYIILDNVGLKNVLDKMTVPSEDTMGDGADDPVYYLWVPGDKLEEIRDEWEVDGEDVISKRLTRV